MHVLFAAEDAHNDGITGVPRPWANVQNEKLLFFNPAYTPTNGQPQLLVRNDSGFDNFATPGGIINSGPLAGTYFGRGGTPFQLQYGPIVSGIEMQGGQASDYLANSGDLDPRLTRQNLFFRTSFDVTDHLQVFGQASYAQAASYANGIAIPNFGDTIETSNPFIPASTQAAISAYNAAHPGTPISSLSVGTFDEDLGLITETTRRSNGRFVIGASGDFNALGSNWTWDAYAQESITDVYTSARVPINANYAAAINAVRNPTTGAIQCASVATNPSCVPYDDFGIGVNSPAATNYIMGTPWGRSHLTQNVESATLHGNPFSDWAGPISIATGVEYRNEAVSGSNDPLSTTDSYLAGNYHATFGSYNVTEGFFETVVPLAKDLPFAKSLDLNGAVRETDYSTSGLVTTYKVGLTYSPIDDLSFRVTRSHDIRAPDLAELFQAGETGTIVVTDPSNGNASSTAFQVTSGNVNLKPEVADTTGFGVVLRPRFIPGFEASVDYYQIDISNAITTFGAQQIINLCAGGDTALCSNVIRSAGVISQVNVVPINAAQQIARGIDFEASYQRRMETIAPFLKGNLTLRFLATHFLENYLNDGVNPPTNTVGENGVDSSSGSGSTGVPSWKYMTSLAWDNGPLALSFTARGVSDGVYNTAYVQCTSNCPAATIAHPTIENNRIPGAYYFDASVNYKLPHGVEAYLAVDNLLDTAPVMTAYGPSVGGPPLSVNPSLYDVLGRTFRFGLRFKM